MPQTTVTKTRSAQARPRSVSVVVDYSFFVFGGASAVWLAWLVFTESFSWGWFLFLFFVLFWVVLAYLVLPRLHRILTSIYVPDYFIGRARTSDGLLGDPINLAALGTEAQLDEAMRKAGWTRADDVTLGTSLRIISSTIRRKSYDEAPVSPLFLFGHQQDVAYQQEVKGNPAKRHHVRFWRCPDGWLLPGGNRADWMAAGTFDRAVGFSLFTMQVTHKIDANTDIERDHIVSTLQDAEVGVTVDLIKDFSTGYHARNGGGDTIETDGDLPVIDVRGVAVDSAAIAVSDQADARRAALAEQRPVPTTLGFLLMLLRVVAGGLTVALTVIEWHRVVQSQLVAEAGIVDPPSRATVEIVVAVVMGLLAFGLVIYLLVAVLVFRGSNWARIAAMSLSALFIIATAIDYFNGGPQVSLHNNLLGLPLDILVVLALSSQRARLWARGRKQRRRGIDALLTTNTAADDTTIR
ncbi:LssY C-terminal domain-containing protein [Leifsonia poae]|uniref:LssY C-terminal domain-containing protein n=1 Tax=Leifsonia poae TaxID=110933 RepID=UPI003D66FFD6